MMGSYPKPAAEKLIWKEVNIRNGLLRSRGVCNREIDNQQCRLAMHEAFCGRLRKCGTKREMLTGKPERSWLWKNGSCAENSILTSKFNIL